MKSKRFFAVFLLLTLLCSLLAVPCAAAEEEEDGIPAMEVEAEAALLVDGDTGEILYAKNEDEELYPASLTKIMTALLVLEAVDKGQLSLDQEITATATAFSGLSDDGSSAGIEQGETMTVENLLYCMLVVSANEACNILGEKVAGTVSAFVEQMNAKAQALGCTHTHFANATGLHDSQHYTSAWDMYLITKEAMKYPTFMTICDTAQYTVPATNLSEERVLHTTNYLLSNWRAIGYTYSNAHGIKTGSTSDAGHCLVSSAQEGSRSLISVVLGADEKEVDGKARVMSFYETRRLFEWGFDNFSRKTILSADETVQEAPVELSRKMNYVTLRPAEDVEALLPNNVSAEDIKREITLTNDPVLAPVTEGQVLGKITLSYDGQVCGETDLLAASEVPASRLLVFQYQLGQFFAKPLVKVLLVLLIAAIVLLVVWRLSNRRRRSRYGGSRHFGSSRNYRGRRRR